MSDTSLLDSAVDRMIRQAGAGDAAAPGVGAGRARLLAAWRDAGFDAALADDAAGGMALSLHDGAVIAWRWGWHAAPLPVVEMLVGGTVRGAAGRDATDEAAASVAMIGRDQRKPIEAPTVDSERLLIIDGDTLITCDGGTRFTSLAGEPWMRATIGKQCARVALPAGTGARVAAMGMLLQAGQMTGAMARVVEMITGHANTRSQFGRPLGKFQAVQHLIADGASEQVACQAALAAAIERYDGGRTAPAGMWALKYRAGRAATVVAAAAHQVMGAMGFTEDHELGRYTRRLWDWRDHWGREDDCAEAIGRAAAAETRGLWRHLIDEPSP